MPAYMRRPLWLIIIIIVLALLVGCATAGAPSEPIQPTTLAIHNTGQDPIAIYIDNFRVGTVGVMQMACIKLHAARERSTLSFRALAGERVEAPEVSLLSSPGWMIELSRVTYNEMLSLVPTSRCK